MEIKEQKLSTKKLNVRQLISQRININYLFRNIAFKFIFQKFKILKYEEFFSLFTLILNCRQIFPHIKQFRLLRSIKVIHYVQSL